MDDEKTAAEGEALEHGEQEADFEAMYREMLDRYQRGLAEFDNYRKRTAREMGARYEDGMRAAAERLLPALDNLERAVHASDAKEGNFYQGVALTLRGFLAAFEEMGVRPIETDPGTEFSANFHNAVAHVEDDRFGENQVAEVLQKGYMFKDKVLRHAMVKVAN